ncbi:Pls/PosA family non-ribosomal peptide synthetase [Sinomonas sp. P47F7]|uniref:Pls/PosA family non-ribosomal peptide synthetase n=1 Tax=Sinomonas sp. P47F7 TaxID=3410987 RepID=UPI003BF597EC
MATTEETTELTQGLILSPADWQAEPDRPPLSRLHHYFEAACDATPAAIALECERLSLTYAQLDARANQLAHYLLAAGVGPGSRVGLLLNRSVELYVALLAAQKAGAAFVPIDPASPADRVAYVSEDSGLALLISASELRAGRAEVACPALDLDVVSEEIASHPASRPSLPRDRDTDPSAYIIYTSGSTGRPKGVDVAQSSICNFINIVPGVYDVRPADRVYQGMTLAFDFSIEEVWPTWAVGATLVAGPTDSRRLGSGLADFLGERRISVLYCVPTVLATIDRDLPLIRGLLVGGEACPAELVERWSTPTRRMLNTYGPTEGTVTATWGELLPGRTVTIGRPLPTYHISILDEDREPVLYGEVGEICIGGPGVARGYINRPEQTADRFLTDPSVPGGRLYRTGDLGRFTENGEIEYLGRADSEVKIRGHRVDLGEIESVILNDRAVAAAAVNLRQMDHGDPELVAYVTLKVGEQGGGEQDGAELRNRIGEQLRDRLPSYMVPGFLEVLTDLPLMPSGKINKKALPKPKGSRLVRASSSHAAAGTALERKVGAVWAKAFGMEAAELSVTADFFLELGGHSLLAAQAASLLRETDFAASVSIADIYAHPTVRQLARMLEAAGAESSRASLVAENRPESITHSSRRVFGAGLAQLVVVYALLLAVGAPTAVVLGEAGGKLHYVELATSVMVSLIVSRIVIPVVGVRLLSWGLRSGHYPLWGWTYLRVWTIRALTSFAPLSLLSGSPLMAPYLRLLGASVGKNCHIATASLALPSMLYIGDEVSVGYNAQLLPFHVERGWVTIKPITVRSHAFIGANAVLQAGSELGYGALLADMSLAAEGQLIPAREEWSGSPASRATEPDALLAELGGRERPARGWTAGHHAGFVAGYLFLEVLALATLAPGAAFAAWAYETGGLLAGLGAIALLGPVYTVTTCAVVLLGKKLALPKTPAGTHAVASTFGLRKWFADKLLQMSLSTTNSMYATLYTVPWLRLLGAKVGRRSEVSTAAHLDPDLLVLGTESFIADMAAVGSATYRNGYVSLGLTEVGNRSFVGNAALLRSGTKMGESALVGVHSMAPVSGVPRGTDWLGSPAMRLPRRQESEAFGDELTYRPTRWRVFERYVIEYIRIVLPSSIIGTASFGGMLLGAAVARQGHHLATLLAAPVIVLGVGLATVLTVAALKWLVVGRYRPRVEPLWGRFVRRTELVTALYEAAAVPGLFVWLTGTPWMGPMLRLFGANVGKRTCISTTFLTEFDLVHIGDDVAVDPNTSLQTHLFEDRVMKMSTIELERGVSVGSRSVVLYDTRVGAGTTVDPLSLVMKGEELPAATRWRGIPSRAVR